MGEARDEGLRLPLPERRGSDEPLAAGGAPAQAREVGLHRRLVEEHQPLRPAPHEGLAAACPAGTGRSDAGASPLVRDQGLSSCVKPSRPSARAMAEWWTCTPSAPAGASRSPQSVTSGSRPTSSSGTSSQGPSPPDPEGRPHLAAAKLSARLTSPASRTPVAGEILSRRAAPRPLSPSSMQRRNRPRRSRDSGARIGVILLHRMNRKPTLPIQRSDKPL